MRDVIYSQDQCMFPDCVLQYLATTTISPSVSIVEVPIRFLQTWGYILV
jgi:hypothetical protein